MDGTFNPIYSSNSISSFAFTYKLTSAYTSNFHVEVFGRWK